MSLANDVEQIPAKPSDRICGIPAYLIGVVSLILVVVGWVSTNFLTQHILAAYHKPFLMTWLNVITFQLYFILYVTGDPLNWYLARKNQDAAVVKEERIEEMEAPVSEGFSLWQTAKLAIFFSLLYVASNYTTTIAFGTTSAGSASILASTCGLFCLMLGALMGVETLSWLKISAVVISLGGVLLLGLHEFGSLDNRLLGNMMALLGAALYGVYSVYLKRIDGEGRLNSTLLFAWTGLYALLACWPILLILHFTGVEVFELPPNGLCYVHILINMFLGALIPNYLWNVAFSLTSPLVVAIGIAFNIPLTLLGEYLLYSLPLPAYKIISASLILLGFALVNLATLRPQWDRNLCCKST